MKTKGKLMALFIGIAFIACGWWFMMGCSAVKGRQTPSCVIFVLFDISGSTAIPKIRQRYFNDFQKILTALRGGELLIGDVITENTMATLSLPINESFPAYNPLAHNPLTHKREMEKAIKIAQEKAKKLLLESPPAPRTDLLNAFQAADKVFNGERCKAVPHKILVVFSDMIEQSSRYDFARENLTEKRIQEIIQTLKKQKQLPNLQGVKVWVAGATAAVKGGLNPKKIYQIQDFWLAYFAACGADLTKERYSTTLLNFELPAK